MQRALLISNHSGQEESCGEGERQFLVTSCGGAVCSKDRKTATHEKLNNMGD